MKRNRELDSIESSVPKNKKLVSFSHANYETLSSIIRDEAYLNDTSESAVIENALVKAFSLRTKIQNGILIVFTLMD